MGSHSTRARGRPASRMPSRLPLCLRVFVLILSEQSERRRGSVLGGIPMRFPIAFAVLVAALSTTAAAPPQAARRPNILLAVSDDQSWIHASAYGSAWV